MEENNVNTNTTGTETEAQVQSQVKTYTEEEVQKMIQSEADRRVSEAMKTAERKKKDAVKEAQKLAAMNEQEKYVYELEQREKALAEKEKALALAENTNEASKILAEKGLSLSLVQFVVAEDAETMKKNIDTLHKAFSACVKAEVEKRLGGKTPTKSTKTEGVSKEQFKKMSIGDLNQLYKENPDLYKQLSGM